MEIGLLSTLLVLEYKLCEAKGIFVLFIALSLHKMVPNP